MVCWFCCTAYQNIACVLLPAMATLILLHCLPEHLMRAPACNGTLEHFMCAPACNGYPDPAALPTRISHACSCLQWYPRTCNGYPDPAALPTRISHACSCLQWYPGSAALPTRTFPACNGYTDPAAQPLPTRMCSCLQWLPSSCLHCTFHACIGYQDISCLFLSAIGYLMSAPACIGNISCPACNGYPDPASYACVFLHCTYYSIWVIRRIKAFEEFPKHLLLSPFPTLVLRVVRHLVYTK